GEGIESIWGGGSIDLSYRAELDLDFEEVRFILSSFNRFLDEVEGLIKKVRNAFSEFELNVGVLRGLDKVIGDSRGVLGAQEEVREMLSEIGGMVEEVSGTVEEMMRSIEVIRGNIEKEYGMIEETSGMIEEVIMTIGNVSKRVSKADEALKGLREEAMRDSAEVRKSVEESKDIAVYLGQVLEVVDVIKGLSDRIEVLAMNAGIEAAHAGEAGRGFAVVADEMGSLAEDSRKKAEEVEGVVKDVIDRVKVVLEKVEESSSKFMKISEGISEVSVFVEEIDASMVEIGKANEEMMRKVSDLVGYSDSVRVAVEESKVGMEEIVKAVYEVSEANSRLSEKFEEVYGVMKEAGEFLVEVGSKLGGMMDSVKKLGEELMKFKVSEVKFSKGITLVE
ncbi:MAG: methyl-accepting chemotaxis protein, partial [Thermosulfidibacteraceae bacterium]